MMMAVAAVKAVSRHATAAAVVVCSGGVWRAVVVVENSKSGVSCAFFSVLDARKLDPLVLHRAGRAPSHELRESSPRTF